jgi:hypothetical protein
MLSILSSVLGIAFLVCWILVEIKMFQNANPIHGIIGIVTCGIYAIIWGWMNKDKYDLAKIVPAMTAIWVVNLIITIYMRMHTA